MIAFVFVIYSVIACKAADRRKTIKSAKKYILLETTGANAYRLVVLWLHNFKFI